VNISNEAIDAAVEMSTKFIANRFLPDKAIDLMDEASAKVKLSKLELPEDIKSLKKQIALDKKNKKDTVKEEKLLNQKLEKRTEDNSKIVLNVEKNDIAQVVSRWTKIPATELLKEEKTKLLHLEDKLHEKIIGQDQAIKALCNSIRRSRVGINDHNKPIGSFIFAGKTGVGKTLVAKTLAEYLFDSPEHFIKIDMSEYQEKHTVSRLIGAPPGYIGFEQGGQLIEHLRRHPYSVILLDEIEKAHPDIFNVLLQVTEDGVITDGRGRKADCRNSIIIMTSNIGALKKDIIGFNAKIETKDEYERLRTATENAMKEFFKPEFLNRIDDVIVFHNLEEDDMYKIVELMINDLSARMKKQELNIKIDQDVKKLLVESGFDKEYGARSLKKFIVRRIENPLAEEMLKDKFKPNDTILITKEKKEIIFEVEK